MAERSWDIPCWMTRKLALVSMAIFLAACSDSGCDCEGFETAPFPEQHNDKTLPLGAQVRVSQSGLDFLEGQVPTLIGEFQPGGLSFCVPPDDGTPDICTESTCDDGSDGCQVNLEIDGAELNPQPTDTLDVDITVGGIGGEDTAGDQQDLIDIHIWGVDCELHMYNINGDKTLPGQLTAKLPITFNINENSALKDLRIDLGDVQMENFTDQVEYDLNGGLGCTVGGWLSGLFNNTINGLIRDQLVEAIAGIESEQLCRACGDGEPACPDNSTCGDNQGTQSCMYADDTCVPTNLGIEGDMMLGQVIGDFSQNPDSRVHTMVKAADHAEVDTGLSLGMRIGSQPDAFGRCVPIVEADRPSFQPVPPSPELLTDARPDGEPFMVGIGMHKRSIEHILWSTWGGGALCMQVDGNDVSQLSASSLWVLLPSIKELADRNSMVYLQIAPQVAPSVKLGANTVTADGDTYTIDDPLMTVDWRDLDLHFYIFTNERFARVFSLRTDLLLPIALAADGQGSVIPMLGDLEGAVTNVRPLRTELLKEDTQALIDLIPTLMGLALPSLADSLSQPFDLPEFMGLQVALDQEDITSVDSNTMVALFADLIPAPTQAYSMLIGTTILGAEVDVSDWTGSGIPRPTATVDLAADLPSYANPEMSTDVEYSYRVDGGIWSMYRRSERLEIRDPMLVLEGRHRIEVRARFRDAPETTELEPAETHVTVDYSAPELTIERDAETVSLAAWDTVDATKDLMFRYRIVDGIDQSEWTPWTSRDTIDLKQVGAPEHFRLVAQVKDRAGHVSEDEQNVVWETRSFEGDTPSFDEQGDEPKAGCQSAGGSSPVGAAGALLVLFGAALLFGRRSKKRLRKTSILLTAMLTLGVSGLGLTGCDDDAPAKKAAVCEPGCTDYQECVEGACEVLEGSCDVGADCTCPEGEIGICGDDNSCSCAVPCADGCEEGQYCCHTSNSCSDMPDPCAEQVCDPGFEPSVSDPGTPDSATCEVSEGACECVELPPLPLGVHGPYASVAENASVRAASVYNRTYTDLMVATVDASGEPTWYFVDGLPDSGDIEGALDGPRGGISDRGEDVGTHTAIGVDASGNLHVLYRDEENKALKYARGTKGADGYDFSIATFDEDGDTGYWSSLLVDDGTVHAVYSAYEVEHPDDGWQTQLRYINFPSDAAIGQLSPEASVLYAAATDNPCGGSCARTEVCFTGSDATCGEPGDCDPSCGDGLECNAGTCVPYYAPGKESYPLMVGVFAQLSTTADGLAVTFYDNLQQQVGWATRTADTWSEAEFLGATGGPYVSGAVDSSGNVHLAYMDRVDQALVYEVVGQGIRETIAEGVRDTTDGYILSDIGEDVDLKLGDDGSVQVLYQDATWHKLHLANRDSAGSWTVETLTEPGNPYNGSHGFFAAMVRNPTSSDLAVDFVINNQADPVESKPEFHTLP
jgi:hypothetical protein